MASRRFAAVGALASLTLSSLAFADSKLTLNIGPTTSARTTTLADESVDIDFSADVSGDPFDSASGRAPQSAVMDASGRRIVAGVSTQADGALQAYVARFATSGALDTSFGAGTGLFLAPLPQPVFGTVPACRIAVTAEDKIVLACLVDSGADTQGNSVPQLTIARVDADGTLDRTSGANIAATEPPGTLTVRGINGAVGAGSIRTPDSFNFTSQNGVPLSTLITSNTVTITGLSGSAVVTVSGGEYSIGCTQTFTSAPSPITEGSQLCVRVMSSATNGLPVLMNLTVTVTVGGGTASSSSSFTVTTVAASGQSGGGGGGGALDRWSLLGLAALGAMSVSRRRRKAVTG